MKHLVAVRVGVIKAHAKLLYIQWLLVVSLVNIEPILKVIYMHGWVHRPLLHPVKVGRARFLRRLHSGQGSFRSTVNHVHKGVNSFSAAIAAISSKMWARKDLKRLFCCFYLLVQHKPPS